MQGKLKKYLLKEQFNPSLIGLFINPFFFARRAIYKNIKYYSEYINGITIDIGCGSKPYADLFSTKEYIGIDLEVSGHNHSNSPVDLYYDGKTIPYKNDHFDSLVCFEVLEHVFNPDEFIKEANRVLKNGGSALFTVPFIWDEHEQPFDYARYTSFGLKHLFEKNGFIVVDSRKLLPDFRILPLLINAYIFKVVRKYIPGKTAYIFILPFSFLNNFLGQILYLLPHNRDLYYGNIFLLKKP